MNLNCSSDFNPNEIRTVKSYSVKTIVKNYKINFGIDVSGFFGELDSLKLLECQNTKYQFYAPDNIDGDDLFYQELQKFDWYYMPWKWEHDYVKKSLHKNHKILEVGSGSLGFIERMQNEGFFIDGLELNKASVSKAKNLGLNVQAEMIQDYAMSNSGFYDVVCSFQVLEHISDVNSFLKAKIDCLKIGGKLIICVPNNDSFIKYSEGGILNFPPHHMGRWNNHSLSNLDKCFNLKLLKIAYEPLQNYHKDWFVNTISNLYLKNYRLVRGFNKMFSFKKLVELFSKLNSNNIKGHSIMAIYEKTK